MFTTARRIALRFPQAGITRLLNVPPKAMEVKRTDAGFRRCFSMEPQQQTSPKENTTYSNSRYPSKSYDSDTDSTTDFGATSGSTDSDSSADAENEDEFQLKLKILEASLNHVNTLGWSSSALKAGAMDLNFSEAVAATCTPFDLVEYFQRSSNHQLAAHLKSLDKKSKSLYSSMEYRLSLVIPYIDRYHQAMGLSLDPSNVPTSLKVLRELSDIICVDGLGDKSTDMRWYTKRTGVSSLYVATEFCMVQDKSEGFKETWNFLERRAKDFDYFEGAGAIAGPMLESGAITLLNILGMNAKR